MTRWVEERIDRPLSESEARAVDWFVRLLDHVMARWDVDHERIMTRKRHERETALKIQR